MSTVALRSRDCVCNPSWPNHMFWEHRLISAIFSVRQLLQRCNLILPAEMPVGTVARTSAILKRLQQKNQMRFWAAFTMDISGFQMLLKPATTSQLEYPLL